MNIRHLAMILIYHSKEHTIKGRTLFQKKMYFLSLTLGMNFRYRPHYYGPYSAAVEEALYELIGIGAVEQSCHRVGNSNSRGFEVQRYDYKVTKPGEELVTHLQKKDPEMFKTIKSFVDKVEGIDNLDYYNLSLAAKLYYILTMEKASMDQDQIQKVVSNLKWNFSDDDVQIASNILYELLPTATTN